MGIVDKYSLSKKCTKFDYIKKLGRKGGLKSYVPVIEDFGLGKTVIEPKTLGTTALFDHNVQQISIFMPSQHPRHVLVSEISRKNKKRVG